jgi:hypothetical protein
VETARTFSNADECFVARGGLQCGSAPAVSINVAIRRANMGEFPVAVTIDGSTHVGTYTIAHGIVISTYGKHRATAPVDADALGTARRLLRQLAQRTIPRRRHVAPLEAAHFASRTSEHVKQVYPVIVGVGLLGWAWAPYLETALMPVNEFSQLLETARDQAPPAPVSQARSEHALSESAAASSDDRASPVSRTQTRIAAAVSPSEAIGSPALMLSTTLTETPRAAAAPRLVKAVKREAVRAAARLPQAAPAPAPEPQVAAVAPPLPFVYFGRLENGDETHVFLRHGERHLSLKAGDQIDEIYRVERIDANSIVFAHLPSQTRQVLSVSGAPALAAATPEPVRHGEVMNPNTAEPAAVQSKSADAEAAPGL